MNGQIVHLEPDPHVAVQRLLPWYVTQRLDAAERAEVDAHLAACPACRAELETERQWQCLQPHEEAQVDVEHGWAAMRARLGAASAPRVPTGVDLLDRPAPPRRRAPAPWQQRFRAPARAWALPGLLSVALLAALGATLRPSATGANGATGDYRALAAPAVDAATAVVRFRPDATEAQIRHSLNESGARLVDGPTVTDAYVVRLPREHYAAALDKLRRQPAVALVEALESASP